MKDESRIKNSLRNLKIAWGCQAAMIIFKFVSRRVFTQTVISEYLGMENLYSSVIGILSLVELGIGGAVAYYLYKPLAENDEVRISQLMYFLKRIYQFLAFVVMGIGLLVMPLLHLLAPEISSLNYAYLIYVIYLFKGITGYLFGYKSILCSADQKNYLYLINHYIFNITSNIAQTIILILYRNYLYFALTQFIFVLLEGVCLAWLINKKYPFARSKPLVELDEDSKKKIWDDVRYIAISRIGYEIIDVCDNLVIISIFSLSMSAVYGNYTMIVASLFAIINAILSSVSSSVGNLVVTSEKDKIIEVFYQLNFINMAIYIWATICLYCLLQVFVNFWVGGSYLLPDSTAILICIAFYIKGQRTLISIFRGANGLFRNDSKKAIYEALLNLGLSVILAKYLGINGVVYGTIISALCVGIPMELWDLNKTCNFGLRRYLRKIIVYTGVGFVTLLCCSYLSHHLSLHWYIRLPGTVLITTVIFSFVWFVLFSRTNDFKTIIDLKNNYLSSQKQRSEFNEQD